VDDADDGLRLPQFGKRAVLWWRSSRELFFLKKVKCVRVAPSVVCKSYEVVSEECS
jgi:hypothetical protein